jgi:hypothetical protein
MNDFALCRRVADGWLILDKGAPRDMRADCDATRQRQYRRADADYKVLRTGRPIGAIVPARNP